MEYPADGSRPHPVYSAEVPTNPSEGGEAVYSRIEGAIRAVSYTHLDVYKRQRSVRLDANRI